MKNEKDLLDWYQKEDEMVVYGNGDQASMPPSQDDMNPAQSGSPQDLIQQQILRKEQEKAQLTSKSDDLIAQDKMNAFKAYGVTEVIRQKLNLYSALAGRQFDDPLAKEGIADDLKKLTIELSDIIGAL